MFAARPHCASTPPILSCETCGLDYMSTPSSVDRASSRRWNCLRSNQTLSPLDLSKFGGETILGTLCASRQSEHEIGPTCRNLKKCTICFSYRNYTHRPSYQIFYHDGEGCKHFSHPNILPVVEISEAPFPFCIMTPWMPGGNIIQYTKKNPSANRLMLVIVRQGWQGRPTDYVDTSSRKSAVASHTFMGKVFHTVVSLR